MKMATTAATNMVAILVASTQFLAPFWGQSWTCRRFAKDCDGGVQNKRPAPLTEKSQWSRACPGGAVAGKIWEDSCALIASDGYTHGNVKEAEKCLELS